MAEILGLGLSHFGGFMFADEEMSSRTKARLEDGSLPEHLNHPSKWPEGMRSEWGNDEGASFAQRHRQQYFDGLDLVHKALNDFKPDAVILFGDDQYECFREDLIPPYCVFVGDEFHLKPYLRARGLGGTTTNIWNDPFDAVITTPGAPDLARLILNGLLERDFEPAYSYKMPHQDYLGHAFTNTLMFLDHRRKGWAYPIVPFAINAYGSALIRAKGGLIDKTGDVETSKPMDPPAPTPRRCFDIGRALAGIIKPTPWRVALIATASFSHAFLTEKNHLFFPDMASDRARHAELRDGDYVKWRELSVATLEDAGQHELLNWCPMLGAMDELGQRPVYCELMESYLMNSNKCVAIIPPN
jgi:hypothetical protein